MKKTYIRPSAVEFEMNCQEGFLAASALNMEANDAIQSDVIQWSQEQHSAWGNDNW